MQQLMPNTIGATSGADAGAMLKLRAALQARLTAQGGSRMIPNV
jgi:hypothetical protein